MSDLWTYLWTAGVVAGAPPYPCARGCEAAYTSRRLSTVTSV